MFDYIKKFGAGVAAFAMATGITAGVANAAVPVATDKGTYQQARFNKDLVCNVSEREIDKAVENNKKSVPSLNCCDVFKEAVFESNGQKYVLTVTGGNRLDCVAGGSDPSNPQGKGGGGGKPTTGGNGNASFVDPAKPTTLEVNFA